MKTLPRLVLFFVLPLLALSCSKSDDPAPVPVVPPPTSAALTITSITPDYGKANTDIDIIGTGFSATSANNTVTIGGVAMTVKSATTTKITVTAPESGTNGNVQVKVGTETATSPVFSYEPIYTSISATSGSVGDDVLITGKHFGGAKTDYEVKFNGTVAEILSNTNTTLAVKIPTGATTGVITIARKTKAAINGPSFTISAASDLFTVTSGSITIKNLIKTSGSHGEVLCMTIDEENNILYAGTNKEIVKVDLATNAVSTIVTNSSFLSNNFAKPSAMDVGPGGKLYLLVEYSLVVPITGNVFVIDPAAKTATLAGSRSVGVGLGGSFAFNTPFAVLGTGEIIAFDSKLSELCKFSPNLSVRTVIYTIPAGTEAFKQIIKLNNNTIRIVFGGLGGNFYHDYATSLSAKVNYTSFGNSLLSATSGGSDFYGIQSATIVDPTNSSSPLQKQAYTIGKINGGQTDFQTKASFTINKFNQVNASIKTYNFIGLNGKNYFYADKNGNMYGLIIPSSDADAGIYKFTIN